MAKLEIFDNSLIKLIVRKGPNSDRIGAILSEGEPGYTVDTKRLFIGDGSTRGGNVVGNKFLGYTTDLTTLPTVPGVVGDIAYNTSLSTLYYIQTGVGTIITDWVPISTNINTVSYTSLYSLVQSTSARWNSGYTVTTSISSKANNVYSTVNSKSGSWDAAYTASLTPEYYYVLAISLSTVSIGTNNTYDVVYGSGGKFVSYLDDFSIDQFILTASTPPEDLGAGEIELEVYINNVPVETLFMYEPSNIYVYAPPTPPVLFLGDRVHINVSILNSAQPVIGLNLYLKGHII